MDYEGTDDGSKVCVYATLAIMLNATIQLFVVSCTPWADPDDHSAPITSGPAWMITLLKKAGVVFVFSDKEGKALRGRGVRQVWDAEARVPRDKVMALSDAWSEGVGAGLGIRALLKRYDASIQWTKRLSKWQDLHENRDGLSAREVSRGWIYAIADVVATLQLGLVQWVRQDAIVVLEPSKTQLRTYLPEQDGEVE